MAFLTATADHREPLASRVLHSIFNGLVSMAENSSRMKSIRTLQAMSDEQLAARGLKREDIARHVFRDVYFAV